MGDENAVEICPEYSTENLPLLFEENMSKESVQISQQVLVSEKGGPNRSRQYVAALVATIGGFVAGTTLGWTSPTELPLENNEYGFPISKGDMGWIGAFMAVGAIFGAVITGFAVDVLGRKKLILLLVIPCTFGWAAMVWSTSVWMFCTGRFLTGIAGGSYTIIVPIYTAEIADKEIRGTLGTYFQLMLTVGILFTYIAGSFLSIYWLTVLCGVIPLVYATLMVSMPETPYFHLKMKNRIKAAQSLRWFRGECSNCDDELNALQESIDHDESMKVPLMEAFSTKAAKRALIIGLGVMFLQQFSGCNAVIFYTTTIFKEAGSNLNPNACTIFIGVVSVIATYIATLFVDRLGRRMLLLFSIVVMTLCTFALGGYFYAKDAGYDVSEYGWLPLASLSAYIVVFSLGFGPIPWLLIGEIFPSQIRGSASSVCCLFNWTCVFFITRFFPTFVAGIGIGPTFWLFTAFAFLGVFFVCAVVPETKGKTLDEVVIMLGGVGGSGVIGTRDAIVEKA